ncbi:MAG: hypothetical protein KF819_17730 [Labilithrix sp.]|nr:hypothetical protein [Labilithrix sp.]
MSGAAIFALLLIAAAVPAGIVMRMQLGIPASLVVSSAAVVGAVVVAAETIVVRRKRLARGPIDLAPEETVAWSGAATRWLRTGGVKGTLVVTSARVLFRPLEPTLLDPDAAWPLGEILGVEPSRSFGVVPNAIRVILDGDRQARFSVGSRAACLAALGLVRDRGGAPTEPYRGAAAPGDRDRR